MERALIALCGLLTNSVIGGPNRWYRVLGIGKLARIPDKIFRDLERRLNREQYTTQERETHGQIVAVTGIVFALVAGFIVGALFSRTEGIRALILMFALPVRPIFDRAYSMRKQLQAKHPDAARQLLDIAIWRHAALLDEHGLARAAIETLAIGFSEKIVAPIFWYVCIGFPGLFITLMLNVMREVLPRPNDPIFSKSAVWAYDIWHLLPSRLAAILWIIAGLFLPARDIMTALKGIGRKFFAAPQVLALASAASVLKLSLGGPTSTYGNHAWQEMGTVKALPGDVRRALYLFALLNALVFVLLGVIA